LHTAQQLADHFDFDLTLLEVDAHGCVSAQQLADAMRPDTVLVSLMQANNEVGSLQPVAELAAVARARGVLFHTDSVQAASQLELDVQALGVDLLSIGAHKFYGPKGVGALYVRKGTQLQALQTGGSQEHGLRAGTQNVPLIAGMAQALQLVQQRRALDNENFLQLRTGLIAGVLQRVPESRLTGHPQMRLPNHASFVFRGVDGNALLRRLDVEGVAASSGSACKTGDPRPSGVLLAMGLQPEWARGSLRLSVGRTTTAADVDYAVQTVERCVAALRK
ncbi:MAG: cysteine desulfurase family protein, partial [Chloroflexi bacterium]|nr:cysteine desulfurase family protein [Chloroflexota bacterium]